MKPIFNVGSRLRLISSADYSDNHLPAEYKVVERGDRYALSHQVNGTVLLSGATLRELYDEIIGCIDTYKDRWEIMLDNDVTF